MQKKLTTSRLILRPFSLEDADVIQKLAGNFNVADTTLSVPYPYENGMAENWISTHETKWNEKKSINFAVTLKSGELIGAMSLHFPFPYLAELGYWIGEPYWNQ
jgi:[ribosomal protein S5]-alanine N-acetyltransferase